MDFIRGSLQTGEMLGLCSHLNRDGRKKEEKEAVKLDFSFLRLFKA